MKVAPYQRGQHVKVLPLLLKKFVCLTVIVGYNKGECDEEVKKAKYYYILHLKWSGKEKIC